MYREKRKKESGKGRFFLISLAISLGVLILTSLVMSLVAYASPDPTGNIGLYSLISLLLSAAVSGFIISGRYGERRIAMTALISLATVLILIIFGMVASGGRLGLGALMNYLSYFGVAVLISLFSKGRQGKRHKKHKHKAH